jgi:hypothetical protein
MVACLETVITFDFYYRVEGSRMAGMMEQIQVYTLALAHRDCAYESFYERIRKMQA